MKRFTFKKTNRLQYQCEFDAVFKRPYKIKSEFLTLLRKPNVIGIPRIGVIVPKRYIKRAVDRNRLKRLIREAFRLNKEGFEAVDLIIMVNQPIEKNMRFERIINIVKSFL